MGTSSGPVGQVIQAPGQPAITAVPVPAQPAKKPAATGTGAMVQMGIAAPKINIINPLQAGGIIASAADRDKFASTNVLIVGDSGTHKTFMAGTFPKPIFADLDKGMGTAGYDKKFAHAVFRDAPKGMNVTQSMRDRGLFPWGEAWPRFVEFVNHVGDLLDKGTCPYETFVIDSLTFMTQIARNNVMLLASRTTPDQGVYGAEQEYLRSIIGPLVIWPIRLVCTAHIQTDKNDVTGNIEKLPLLTGKLAGLIGAFFEEVYYTNNDGTNWTLSTKTEGSLLRQCKSRRGVPNGTKSEWQYIQKYVEP